MCVVWGISHSGHSGDVCDLSSCKYDLFVISWIRVRQVRQGSISSQLLMGGGGVHSILLLPLVARCIETIDLCIWRMLVFMSVVVIVWVCGNGCYVAAVVEGSVLALRC